MLSIDSSFNPTTNYPVVDKIYNSIASVFTIVCFLQKSSKFLFAVPGLGSGLWGRENEFDECG
jgi:hypothetical protein